MSGTSLDGVDGVLARFDDGANPRVLAHAHQPFPASLRAELLALNAPGSNEMHRAALAGNALAEVYSTVVGSLLLTSALKPTNVRAIGAHGQTVRHRPGEFDSTGYTVQVLNGALLAERCGIDVVCDLRSRDVAAGGQGAPLAPGLHAAVFARQDLDVAVLNLGGIGNLTLLARDKAVIGFDCGPANALLDHWCELHTGAAFDAGGSWAASGHVDTALLDAMLAEPYLALLPPKSTGRDLFNPRWLEAHLTGRNLLARDVQATLAEFTCRCVADALRARQWRGHRLVVCGGGAFNTHLMKRLQALLPGAAVVSSAQDGVPPDQVEALAFAWLAQAFCESRPGNLPSVTGAAGPRILGALHRA